MAALGLQQRWLQLCKTFSTSLGATERWWTILDRRYTEVQRHYHTLDHLAEMFTHLDQWEGKLTNKTSVELATFFHDIVYEPKSSTNEEDSIKMFHDFSKDANLDHRTEELTVNLIAATVTHVTEGDDSNDMRFFLDFDMAVLARPADGYDLYADQIRKEYSHFDSNTFSTKRAKVLANFLTRARIFSTDEFHQRYEEKARRNLAREISKLQQNVKVENNYI